MSPTSGRPARRDVVVALVAAAIAVTGCGGRSDDQPIGAQPTVPPSIYVLPVPVAIADPAGTRPGAPAATFALDAATGVVRPDPAVTPGAWFPDVDAADICELHYIQGIRQPRYNTKVEAFAQYGVSIRQRDTYQVDHLVPLSLGGSNELTNLWPQPYDREHGAQVKDQLERQLRGLVCSGTLTLAEAQHRIATDWWTTFQSAMDVPILPGSDGLPTWARPEAEPGEVVNGGPCPTEGQVGYTEPKHVALTCTATSFGTLAWRKRA